MNFLFYTKLYGHSDTLTITMMFDNDFFVKDCTYCYCNSGRITTKKHSAQVFCFVLGYVRFILVYPFYSLILRATVITSLIFYEFHLFGINVLFFQLRLVQ